MSEHDDPRGAGGQMFDAGDPHARGQVMFDSRKAVLVEKYDVAVAHTRHGGEPAPDVVAVEVHGRMNRPPDDASSAAVPAEPIHHLHMLGWELAADLVANLHALAARDGTDERFNAKIRECWDRMEAEGYTRRAA